MLQHFHPDAGLREVGAPGEGAVGGEQHRRAAGDERLHGIAKRRRARGGVGHHRDVAQQQGDLGKHVVGYRFAGHREGRGGRRVGMHHRAAVGPAPIHPEVQI